MRIIQWHTASVMHENLAKFLNDLEAKYENGVKVFSISYETQVSVLVVYFTPPLTPDQEVSDDSRKDSGKTTAASAGRKGRGKVSSQAV